MEGSSDAELMVRVQAGDRDAFAEVVDRYKDTLIGYLARMTGCRARAEDVAQETFLTLYRHSSGYRETGRLRAYLYRIASNRLRSDHRREQRRHMLGWLTSGDGSGLSPPTPQAEALGSETQRHVAEALDRLPVRFRAPLLLHTVEGMPYQTVAEVLGCREGTVKSRISRGRQMLKKELAPYLESPRLKKRSCEA